FWRLGGPAATNYKFFVVAKHFRVNLPTSCFHDAARCGTCMAPLRPPSGRRFTRLRQVAKALCQLGTLWPTRSSTLSTKKCSRFLLERKGSYLSAVMVWRV